MGALMIENGRYLIGGQELTPGMIIRRFDEVARGWFLGEVGQVSSFNYGKQQWISSLCLVVPGFAPSPLQAGDIVEVVRGDLQR